MPWWDEDQTPQLLQKPQESFGPDGDYFGPEGAALYKQRLDAYNAQQAALAAAMPKLKSKEDFMATIKPGMLDEQGRFKGPQAGVNFMYEGLTPDDAYSRFSSPSQPTSINGDESDTSSLSYWQNKQNAINGANATLDAGWREGPDNGGGVLGGLGRAVVGAVKGIASNPALMAAVTAGVGGALSSGVQSATGWTAGTSKAVSSGIINGARTLASGGNLTDALKSGVLSTAGGVAGGAVGSEVKDFTGSAIAAKIASDFAKSAITGGNVASSLLSSGANAVLREITDAVPGFGDLTDAQKGIINSAIAASLKGKNVTPALISNIISGATAQVTKVKQHSGWS